MTRTIKKRRDRRKARVLETGYRDCACRDCFEAAIGPEGAMCWECEEAGCEPNSECCVDRSKDSE